MRGCGWGQDAAAVYPPAPTTLSACTRRPWNEPPSPLHFTLPDLPACLQEMDLHEEAITALHSSLNEPPLPACLPAFLQEMDLHEEAITALQSALEFIDPDEPPLSTARLHYAIAQVAQGWRG